MSCCCEITDRTFGEQDARRDLRNYRRHGPPAHTRRLLDAVRSLGLSGATLLDVGGGVGVIHHELLDDVAARAIQVETSSAYLKAARQEADALGHADRVTFLHADFTDAAPQLAPADIVTLDRVVCCYPDFRALLGAAASRARKAVALVYPREKWYVRLAIQTIDFVQSLRKDPFRVFLHPVSEMGSVLKSAGFNRIFMEQLGFWEIALYSR